MCHLRERYRARLSLGDDDIGFAVDQILREISISHRLIGVISKEDDVVGRNQSIQIRSLQFGSARMSKDANSCNSWAACLCARHEQAKRRSR
jgi:hypothetical protein